MVTDKTKSKHSGLIPYKPGQSGNPAGRPLGSRNKLGEAFIRDLFEHWEANGKKALDSALKDSPAQYMRVVASLLPKNITVKTEDPLGHLSDDQVKALLNAARNLAGIVGRVGDEKREGESGSVH